MRYAVSGMHCAHCERAVKDELAAVSGVDAVEVNFDTKLVVVHGERLDDRARRVAIEEAGYEAA